MDIFFERNFMKGLEQYQSINTQASVMDADKHQLITLLYDKILESIIIAKANITAKAYDKKCTAINKAIEVLGGLREFLDFKQGGEIAEKLEQLYEWSERTLFAANFENSLDKLDQVDKVIREIREGWLEIRDQVMAEQE